MLFVGALLVVTFVITARREDVPATPGITA
jgi:hypothetical protein